MSIRMAQGKNVINERTQGWARLSQVPPALWWRGFHQPSHLLRPAGPRVRPREKAGDDAAPWPGQNPFPKVGSRPFIWGPQQSPGNDLINIKWAPWVCGYQGLLGCRCSGLPSRCIPHPRFANQAAGFQSSFEWAWVRVAGYCQGLITPRVGGKGLQDWRPCTS